MLMLLSRIRRNGVTCLIATSLLVLSTQARSSDLEFAEFPLEGQNGDYLALERSAVAAGETLPVRFARLPDRHKHFLVAFIAERGAWRAAVRKEVQGQAEGTWEPPMDWAGEYLVCVGLGPDMALYGKAPREFDECLRAYATWGDPARPPRPAVELSTDTVVPGEVFGVRYSGMPPSDQAQIEIARFGTPVNTLAPVRHATRGAESGDFAATLREPGRYELRIYYESLGRQVRATLPIAVAR